MNNTVYIVKCSDYQYAEKKILELFSMMGGISRFVKPGENIVLKVNLLQPANPEKGVTTHPAVVAAIARMAKREGAIPVIADSPGSGYKYDEKSLDKLYHVCGMYQAAEEAGIEVNRDITYKTVSFPEGKLIKRFEVITPVVKADGVFNLCKMKTHLFMHMTGAVKNSFGVIPGLTKPGYHAKLHDKQRFAEMLLDLSDYVSPRLSIMDAVIGLEGEGPGAAGEPRHIGLLLAATNPLALDIVASEIMGLKREQNPLLIEAEKRGFSPNSLADVQIIGENISELRISDYKFPATLLDKAQSKTLPWWQQPLKPFLKFAEASFGNSAMMSWGQKIITPLFRNGMALYPQIIKNKCVGCGACRDSCPMEAITLTNRVAQINKQDCIRCYCCHEMCPAEAIELRQSLLYRIVNR